ncbi:MAG: hypothetical protein FWC27_10810 [Firmicutes bacterium]|nr:hypothetical protein [Bacillota bacterium]
MKKRTKIILACTAAILLPLAGLLIYTSVLRPWSSPVHAGALSGEPAEFGASGQPAIMALERLVARGAGILERETGEQENGALYLHAPDRSIRLQSETTEHRELMDDEEEVSLGFSCLWRFAIDLSPFYEAGLHEQYWLTGFFRSRSFREASMDSALHGHSWFHDGYGVYGYSSGEMAFAQAGAPDFAAALESSPELISETAPGTYRLELGQGYFEWSEPRGYLAFVLDAQPFVEGRLKPKKLAGWDYDKESNALIKRITVC